MTTATAAYEFSRDWEADLPRSEIAFPASFSDRIKYALWRIYTPFHPLVRDAALVLGIVSHSGRQNFLIGKIAPNRTFKEVIDFLISRGYGNHFIAWKDDGELVSLRRLVGFSYQYHLRIFQDGEIRGHYEYTPECYPILHFRAVDQKDCRDEFQKMLGDLIVLA